MRVGDQVLKLDQLVFPDEIVCSRKLDVKWATDIYTTLKETRTAVKPTAHVAVVPDPSIPGTESVKGFKENDCRKNPKVRYILLAKNHFVKAMNMVSCVDIFFMYYDFEFIVFLSCLLSLVLLIPLCLHSGA